MKLSQEFLKKLIDSQLNLRFSKEKYSGYEIGLTNNEYGDKDKLIYKGLIKTNFYDIDIIHELNNNIKGEKLPKVLKQGKVVCVIGKPKEHNIVGIFYHEHRAPLEFIKWSKSLYDNFLIYMGIY